MAYGTQVFLYQPDDGTFEELTAETGPGFGDPSNKYGWSGTLFDGDGDGIDELYIGTWSVQPDIPGIVSTVLRAQATNASLSFEGSFLIGYPAPLKSEGGEIWRYDFEDGTWSAVMDVTHPDLDDGDPGFRELTEYNGQLYAASGRPANMSQNPTKLFVSDDGETWTQISGGPLDPAQENNSIRTMQVVQGPDGADVLLVGTTNYVGESQIWSYDETGAWTLLATAPQETISDFLVDSETGEVYVGTWNSYKLYKLDMTQPPGSSLTDVTPYDPNYSYLGAGPSYDQGLIEVVEFDGWYYIGSANYGGTSLFRTQDLDDPDSWEVITTDGFETFGPDRAIDLLDDEMDALGVMEFDYTWQMQAVGDYLYVAGFSSDSLLSLLGGFGEPALVLRTDDPGNPDSWEILPYTYGDDAYGVRTMLPVGLNENGVPDGTTDPNAIIIASATPFDALLPFEEFYPTPGGTQVGRATADLLAGAAEEDVLLGFGGADTVLGGAEDDIIAGDGLPGRAGDDTIEGGGGDDALFGNRGADQLFGGADQDLIVGGAGADTIHGGGDADLLIGDLLIDDRIVAVLENLGLGPDNTAALTDLPEDSLLLDLAGFAFTWRYDVKEVAETVLGTDLFNRAYDALGLANDLIYGGDGADMVLAGDGADEVWGEDGSDVVYGGAGGDMLDGGAGEDYLFGDQGRDRLSGGADDDLLRGGAGNDTLRGGAGADIFEVGDPDADDPVLNGDDIIFDFAPGEDLIDLTVLGLDPAGFADDLAAATAQAGPFSTEIDLAALGGEGTLRLVGVSPDEIGVDDFLL